MEEEPERKRVWREKNTLDILDGIFFFLLHWNGVGLEG